MTKVRPTRPAFELIGVVKTFALAERIKLAEKVQTAVDHLAKQAELAGFEGDQAEEVIFVALRALARRQPEDLEAVARMRRALWNEKPGEQDKDTAAARRLMARVGKDAPRYVRKADDEIVENFVTWFQVEYQPGFENLPFSRRLDIDGVSALFSRYATTKARGKLTTEGIVADILLKTGAVGTSPETPRKKVLNWLGMARKRTGT